MTEEKAAALRALIGDATKAADLGDIVDVLLWHVFVQGRSKRVVLAVLNETVAAIEHGEWDHIAL